MPSNPSQAKRAALLSADSLHPRSEEVSHALFQQHPFFDPNDLLQVKYEALRAWEFKEQPVSSLADAFALSRPTLYAARTALRAHGLAGLLPNKRGPKQAHKLTDNVLLRLRQLLEADSTRSTSELLDALRDELGVTIHLRTLEKALRRGLHLKKGLLTS
jgi:transposase